jgi:hypothetical protein
VSTTKRIVCLANSRKLSGRCVAGKELSGKRILGWVRPVSEREHEEVSEHERQYADGSDPRVMDIIDVPLMKPMPKSYQPENWLLDADTYWKLAGRMSWNDVQPLIESPPSLWSNDSSTYHGLFDRVSLETASNFGASLYLLRVSEATLQVFAPGANFGNPKRRVQLEFTYAEFTYRLWVTDPVIERNYLAGGDGEYSVGNCLLVVSLGEPYDGFCYKLVATIIMPSLAAHGAV